MAHGALQVRVTVMPEVSCSSTLLLASSVWISKLLEVPAVLGLGIFCTASVKSPGAIGAVTWRLVVVVMSMNLVLYT